MYNIFNIHVVYYKLLFKIMKNKTKIKKKTVFQFSGSVVFIISVYLADFLELIKSKFILISHYVYCLLCKNKKSCIISVLNDGATSI